MFIIFLKIISFMPSPSVLHKKDLVSRIRKAAVAIGIHGINVSRNKAHIEWQEITHSDVIKDASGRNIGFLCFDNGKYTSQSFHYDPQNIGE